MRGISPQARDPSGPFRGLEPPRPTPSGIWLSPFALTISLLAALAAGAQPRIAEPPESREGVGLLEVTLTPPEITVGDRVEVELTLIWTGPAPSSEPRFPAWRDAWGGAEVLSAGAVETVAAQGARRVYRQTLELTAFTVGEVRLPEVAVALEAGGEQIEIRSHGDSAFEVRSVLPQAPAEIEPRPPTPPRRLAGEGRFLPVAAGLGGFSLLAALALGRRLRAPTAGAGPTPDLEPLPELLRHLGELDPAAAEPAHTGLSLGLRTFLDRSLGFPAAESTTTEIDRRLRRARIGSQTAESAVRLLRDCDLVKFARVPVGPRLTRGRLRQARELGYEIDRGLRPGDDEAASPAGGAAPEARAR